MNAIGGRARHQGHDGSAAHEEEPPAFIMGGLGLEEVLTVDRPLSRRNLTRWLGANWNLVMFFAGSVILFLAFAMNAFLWSPNGVPTVVVSHFLWFVVGGMAAAAIVACALVLLFWLVDAMYERRRLHLDLRRHPEFADLLNAACKAGDAAELEAVGVVWRECCSREHEKWSRTVAARQEARARRRRADDADHARRVHEHARAIRSDLTSTRLDGRNETPRVAR